MTRLRHQHHLGFTLIEVIVAMAVIALGIGALLTTLNTAAGAVSQLRDRSFAEWIALNRISETRLATSAPGTGVTSGEIDYAGSKWMWRQEVTEPPEATGILRINVSVAHAGKKASEGVTSGESFPAMATVYGFIGTNMGTRSALDPTWSQIVPPRSTGSTGPGIVLPGGT